MGHLNPMTALARKLQSRGHEVSFIGIPDIEPAVRSAGLSFVRYCDDEYPVGSMIKVLSPAATMRGLSLAEFAYRDLIPGLNQAALEHLPGILAEAGIEALVIDTIHSFVELVPMSLDLPYVHVWNVLPVDCSGITPPAYFDWAYETTPDALERNLAGWKSIEQLMQPLWNVAQPWAKSHGLDIDWSDPLATFSKLAVIAQTPREFDFPAFPWPDQFLYTGPFHDDDGREQIPFPWNALASGKPLIYASMGTLVNGLEQVYRTILAAAAARPEMQFVVSVGSNLNLDDLQPIPPNAVVVGTAPQLEILKRAALCITHAGLNTTLEALGQGVPIVAVPIGFDQPGVAARIAYHRVGEFVAIEQLTAERLSDLIDTVLNDPAYHKQARYFKDVLANIPGLDRAAEVIEEVFLLEVKRI